ncbi:DEAD/DEAH box helicase [Fusobacterium necrophorum]|uniref:DEAD/DEAH box helicase n=1 Tax=Fusobacterium necrophorum TaxID=859 RepID=UPI000D125D58|nr:DEAD/DEAH box helicase family protein [Fusobacterium necrophorum]AVQ20688.1 restriction endonuclease subunit R [Fusobacterium necrophorum subsp. funduliforme]
MKSHFKIVPYQIFENKQLRDPQKFAYLKAYQYYNKNYEERETIIVLPTGVGKTGVISILPFGISNGRVLIISPQLTIKEGILNNLSSGSENFYYKYSILENKFLPIVVEYKKELPIEYFQKAHIVVVNIQKLQTRLTKGLIQRIGDPNFFDMIIIDEGHHSTANTWQETINHFHKAKIIKITATPFRADGEKLKGERIYEYPLSAAMANQYVKSLENICYTPEELKFTLDKNPNVLYSLREILELKDEDWLARSVAYSRECSKQIVIQSKELLKQKREGTEIPHKIIAVACSISHAEEIKELYEEQELKAVVLHSNLTDKEKEKSFKDIENHRVDVVIHVAMLGEGYDHKYLSIAAIFRPFKSLLSYSQFIGRILRYIPEGKIPKDNIGQVIAHQNLNLDKLWEYYKSEIEKTKIIKEIGEEPGFLLETEPREIKPKDIGTVVELGEGKFTRDSYIDTVILEQNQKKEEEEKEKIKQLVAILGIDEEKAKEVIYTNNLKEGMNRPDLIYFTTKQNFDVRIRENIIPNILSKMGKTLHEKNILITDLQKGLGLSYNQSNIIIRARKDNGGILGMAVNLSLKEKIGRKREEWDENDFEHANEYLSEMEKFWLKSLSSK